MDDLQSDVARQNRRPEQPVEHPWKALVVDDSYSTRQLLRLYLESAGYAVEEAADGVKAFARLSHRGDRYITLLDYSMPEMDGWETLRLCAADPRIFTQHAFIVMTAEGASLPAEFRRFLAQREIPCIFKPIGRLELFALLDKAEQRLDEAGFPGGTS